MRSKFTQKLLQKKGLEPDIFKNCINLSDPIENHAAWIYKNILSRPYPENINETPEEFARSYHGMTHSCRTAIYVAAFANFYSLLINKEGMFDAEAIKLLQICMFFHDSGRMQDNGKDVWDLDSAVLCYLYLENLGVPKAICTKLAENMANRDLKDIAWKLIDTGSALVFEKIPYHNQEIPEEILMQAADCYDILRAVGAYRIKHLRLYQIFGKSNPWAFTLLTHFILEARSFITLHGDSYMAVESALKKKFECEDGFLESLQLLEQNPDFLLCQFYNKGQPLPLSKLRDIDLPKDWDIPYDPALGMNEKNVQAALREGKIFARGFIYPPSAQHPKPQTIGNNVFYRSFAAVENYKTGRKPGVPTSSSKADCFTKNGNPARSVAPLSLGTFPATAVGYLIMNPDNKSITSLSKTNEKTGFFKKEKFVLNNKLLNDDEIELRRQKIFRTQKKGGMAKGERGYYPLLHPEITYNVSKFHGVFLCTDPLAFNEEFSKSFRTKRPLSLVLQAIHIRIEHEKMYGISLPIFEYSARHFFIKQLPEDSLTEEKILEYWSLVIMDYYKEQWTKILKDPLAENGISKMAKILNMSIDDLKIEAVYNPASPHQVKYQPADENYSLELQGKINEKICFERDNFLQGLKETTPHVICQNLDELMAAATNDVNYLQTHGLFSGMSINTLHGALSLAVINNCYKFFHYILENMKDMDWNNILLFSLSFKYNRPEMISLLIKNGVNPDKVHKTGKKPYILQAMLEKNYEMLEILLKNGADPALEHLVHIAESQSYKKCLSMLLQYGANPHVITKNGLSFYQNMLWKKTDFILPFIEKYDGNSTVHPIRIDMYKHFFQGSILEDILAEKIHAEQKTIDVSFLELAILFDNKKAVKALLTQENIEQTNIFGFTPLEIADAMDNFDIIEIIESSGFLSSSPKNT